MKFFRKSSLLLAGVLMGLNLFAEDSPYKVAFISDVHFHDVYADFGKDFTGLKSEKTGKYATIRTMDSQMNSTRLFNENYFAFVAALEDIASKGIKYVALPGDFSDDGQPVHVEGFKKVLEDYNKKYDMEFFVTFGNHDPTTPYTRPKGKSDYLGVDGNEQPIFSEGAKVASNSKYSNAPIITEHVKEMGYEEMMTQIENFGLFPSEEYLYWESPFSTYDLNSYTYKKALEESKLSNRTYKISNKGSGDLLEGESFEVIDGSYLVEPVEGLWLLAIDSNVYTPKADATDKKDGNSFSGSGNAGYNKVLTHKKHIVEWVKSVAEEAEKNGKTLLAFSHHPMVEFYDSASGEIKDIFGDGNLELARVPKDEVAKTFADAGIKIHMAGHMHFNDTGVVKNDNGNYIVNIQVPSIAAYIPAYKVVSVEDNNTVNVDTVVLNEVPRFNELFEHYEKEYETMVKNGKENKWNKDILKSKSYYELTDWHIQELVRLRFLPREWPQDLKENIISLNGKEMFILSQVDSKVDISKMSSKDMKATDEWKKAEKKANDLVKKNGLSLADLEKWNGVDLATDFYRFRNAGELAKKDISQERVDDYIVLSEIITSNGVGDNNLFADRYKKMLIVLNKFIEDAPSQKFNINLENGEIEKL